MRVHVHTKFCFLCVLTFLFHQCTHCHGEGHHHHDHDDHDHAHDHAHDDRQISQAPYLDATPPPPGSSSKASLPADALEEEQRFYIQQLFSRYGQKDKLDFQGFQRLLMSLGLGELKLVGMEHEELGHDHVAHLDVLEVQEGLHSHLPTHEGGGGGGHGHGPHKHPHKKAGAHPDHPPHTHTEQRPTQQATGASPPSGSGPRTEHDHKHENDYNHDHDHENGHGHEGEHSHDHDETKVQRNEHKHAHEQDNDHRHHHDHHSHHEHDHANDHDHKPPPPHQTQSVDVPPIHQEQPPSAPLEPSQGPREQPTEPTAAASVPSSLVSGAEVSAAAPTVPAVSRTKRPGGGRGKQAGGGGGKNRERGRNKTAVPVSPPPAVEHRLKHDHDHDNDHEQTREHEQSRDHDHDDDHDHDSSHSHKKKREAPAPTVPAPAVEQRGLKHDHDHDRDNAHEQNHDHDRDRDRSRNSRKKKREAPSGPVKPTLPALPGHPDGLFHQHEECLNLTQLLSYYGLNPDSLISPDQFTFLCPALLYQIDMRVCIHHYHQMDVEEEALEHVNPVWVWVWGFVSITIISLLSLLGVILVPILNQSCFKFLLTFLVALAVGTLSGDALLHLLPHSQGQHDHSNPGEPKEEQSMLVEFDGVWKGLTALSGIYLLFIIEHCIGMFKHYKDQGGRLCGRKRRSDEAKIGRKLSDHKLNRRSDAEWLNLKPLTEGGNDSGNVVSTCDNGHNDTQLSELQPPDSPTNKTPLAPATTDHHDHDHHDHGGHTPSSPVKENGGRKHGHHHGHGHSHGGGNCHSDQEMKDAGIASIAWMVIMGDGMHNFSDGLAIGAAFSANTTGGISTSVAVFCHELPHELGDFAVLIKAGMSVKQAIVYNLLSALMAYIGMLIGIAVGQNTHNVTNWIFAVTAGMFLYVALVDMLPEMLHGDSEEHKRCHMGHFVLQNMGLLTGFAIMLLIAIFEDQIVLDFGF